MRILVSVLSLGVILGVLAPACSSSSSAAADDTCAFIADPANCYRTLVAAVDDCLTDASGDAGTPSGKLSADGTSCTYTGGRTVTFVGDARQYGGSSNPPTDVTVALGGKTCLHLVTTAQSGAFTHPNGGILRLELTGSGETITCPDGSRHGIDIQKVFGGCGDAGGVFSGGLPGTAIGGGNSPSGRLVGQKKDAYSCTSL